MKHGRASLCAAVAVGALWSLLLAWLAPSAMAATVPPTFTDVPPTFWAAADIAALSRAHVLDGYPDGSFRPQAPVSRAQMVAMVVRLARVPAATQAAGSATYADVPTTAWYAAAVSTARSLGWLPFVTGRYFAPDQPMTREEAVTLVVTALGLAPGSGDLSRFRDGYEVAPWALHPLVTALDDGLIHGEPDQTLAPAQPLTRADAAALLDAAFSVNLGGPTASGLVLAGGHAYHVVRTLHMIASTYTTGEPGVGTVTYTGTRARVGEAAVDPSVIPLDTWLWVSGYNSPLLPAGGILEHAEDIGGAIRGLRIDMYVSASPAATDRFGLQPVTVYVLAPLH